MRLPWSYGRAEIVLNLLLPAFATGLVALDRNSRNFERLQRAIAESDMDVSVHEDDIDSGAFLTLPLPEPETSFLAVSPPDTATQAARLAGTCGLTRLQQDTARFLLDGLSTRDVADRLGISINAARRHCEAVLYHTGARRHGELNRLAWTSRTNL